MPLKQIITLEDCLAYPLPPSKALIERSRISLSFRVFQYQEIQIESLKNQQSPPPDHLFLLHLSPMTKRRCNVPFNQHAPSINKKVRRQS